MAFAYLALLSVSLLGMFMIDRRFKLAYFADRRRTVWVLLLGVATFLLWDIAGIALGIFSHGDSPFDLGVLLLPELPLEEILFLLLLVYLSLIAYRLCERRTS